MRTIVRKVSFPSALLESVKSPWRSNSKTLGFLPEGAFDEYAQSGGILAAINDDELHGYIAFRVRRGATQIVHLCIAEQFRRQGVAKMLVDDLIAESTHSTGIQVNCREDYVANDVWPKLGFTVRDEIAGRATSPPSKLKIWWRGLGKPDLFSLIPSAMPTAAIDGDA